MEKLDKKLECPKCGFRPTFQKEWKLEFKNDCSNFGYNKCEWDDSETKEHLHQECPDCGYTLPVPCMDAESVKANTWSTSAKPAVPATTKPAVVTPITKPVTTVYTPPKPAKCSKCPVDAKETAEA